MTIEQNLAQYRELLDKYGEGSAVLGMASYRILRDLETAVEVIKVLENALTYYVANPPHSDDGTTAADALALAAEKMGE